MCNCSWVLSVTKMLVDEPTVRTTAVPRLLSQGKADGPLLETVKALNSRLSEHGRAAIDCIGTASLQQGLRTVRRSNGFVGKLLEPGLGLSGTQNRGPMSGQCRRHHSELSW